MPVSPLVYERFKEIIKHKTNYAKLGERRNELLSYKYSLDKSRRLKQYGKSEAVNSFNSRVEVTELIDGDLISSLELPARKVFNVESELKINEDLDATVKQKIQDNLEKNISGKSIFKFLQEDLIDQSSTDPESGYYFRYVGDIDRVVPEIVSGKDILDYQLSYGTLISITFKLKIDEVDYIVLHNIDRVIIYNLDDETYISNFNMFVDGIDISINKFKRVPFVFTGFVRSKTKYSLTDEPKYVNSNYEISYVPFYYNAIPYLKKLEKTTSELDVTTKHIAFLNTIRHASKCSGWLDENGIKEPCNNGHAPDGSVCKACGGTGFEKRLISSSEEYVVPTDFTKDNMIDLDNVVKKIGFPVEVPQFQLDYIKYLKESAIKAVYNTDFFSTTAIQGTATAKQIDQENAYDVVRDFASHYESIINFYLDLLASIYNKGQKVGSFIIDKELRITTLNSLINDLDVISKSNSPNTVKVSLINKINERILSNQPELLKKITIQNAYDPMIGKSEVEKQYDINNGLFTDLDVFISRNIVNIFSEIEKRNTQEFYSLEKTSRDLIFNTVVSELYSSLSDNKTKDISSENFN